MRTISYFIIALLFTACGDFSLRQVLNTETINNPSENNAQSYLVKVFSNDSVSFGYMSIKRNEQGILNGNACLTTRPWGGSIETSRYNRGEVQGTLFLEDKMELSFLGLSDSDLPNTSLTFHRESGRLNQSSVETVTWVWLREDFDSAIVRKDTFEAVLLEKIPLKIKNIAYSLSGDDNVVFKVIGSAPESEPRQAAIPLSVFDGMNREEAFRYNISQRLSIGGEASLFTPGILWVVFARENLEKVKNLVDTLSPEVVWDVPKDVCQAPYLFEEFEVPPLLEFYYARKLQVSGLVKTAYVVPLPADPGTLILVQRDGYIHSLLSDTLQDIGAVDNAIEDYFLQLIESFAKKRRNATAHSVFVERTYRQISFKYRYTIISPALSSCDQRWEKIVFEFSVVPLWEDRKAVQVWIDVREGFWAPARIFSKRRPTDKRFEDNVIRDDKLRNVQGLLASYVSEIGAAFDKSEEAYVKGIACGI